MPDLLFKIQTTAILSRINEIKKKKDFKAWSL